MIPVAKYQQAMGQLNQMGWTLLITVCVSVLLWIWLDHLRHANRRLREEIRELKGYQNARSQIEEVYNRTLEAVRRW